MVLLLMIFGKIWGNPWYAWYGENARLVHGFATDPGNVELAVALPWRFPETPARVDRWTPDLGEHNIQVFHGLLGLSLEEVIALQAARVIWSSSGQLTAESTAYQEAT